MNCYFALVVQFSLSKVNKQFCTIIILLGFAHFMSPISKQNNFKYRFVA